MESEIDSSVTFPVAGENKMDTIKREGDRIYINKTQYFGNISNTVWEFYVGDYCPSQKYLKDRKGRTLSLEEIDHYRQVIAILIETQKSMEEIDSVYSISEEE